MRSAVSCSTICDLWGDRSPSLPFLGLCVGKYGVRWVFSTEFLQCDGASWWLHAGVVPACSIAMDTSYYAWGDQAPVQPLRHQFPSSSIGNEFRLSSLVKVTLVLCLNQTWACCSRNFALWQNLDYKMLSFMCTSQCNEFWEEHKTSAGESMPCLRGSIMGS